MNMTAREMEMALRKLYERRKGDLRDTKNRIAISRNLSAASTALAALYVCDIIGDEEYDTMHGSLLELHSQISEKLTRRI